MLNKTKGQINQTGQLLIEIIIVVVVVAVMFTALAAILTSSVRNADYARHKSIANKYVIEGLEATRSIKERDWFYLYNMAHGNELGLTKDGNNNWVFSGSFDNPADGFTRVVKLTKVLDTNELVEVEVKVKWRLNSGEEAVVSATTKLSRW